jgi:hypothetical protein
MPAEVFLKEWALKSQSEDYVHLSDNIIQLAQDFDFDDWKNSR